MTGCSLRLCNAARLWKLAFISIMRCELRSANRASMETIFFLFHVTSVDLWKREHSRIFFLASVLFCVIFIVCFQCVLCFYFVIFVQLIVWPYNFSLLSCAGLAVQIFSQENFVCQSIMSLLTSLSCAQMLARELVSLICPMFDN